MHKFRLIVWTLTLIATVLFGGSVYAQDPCEGPGNLTFNCQFDTFGPAPGGEVPQGWWPFVLAGHPAFDRSRDTPKEPSLRIWSDGENFVAGIYQEVSGVTPVATYEAFVGWAVFQSNGPQMGRSIGIDPTGGTDPNSPNMVWSQEVWEKKRSNPELRVRAVAQAEKITVFLKINHPASYGADQAFVDAVSLVRDESVPIADVEVTPVPADTSTPLPTDTPTPELPAVPADTAVPPTDTPQPMATAAGIVTPTPTSTATAVATATATPLPTNTATPSPTPARTPTVWVLAQEILMLQPTAHTMPEDVYRENARVIQIQADSLVLLAMAVVAIIGSGLLLWRRSKRGAKS